MERDAALAGGGVVQRVSGAASVRALTAPLRGDDGLWRRMVEVDGQPAVQVVSAEEVLAGSASWARTTAERAALADLERER